MTVAAPFCGEFGWEVAMWAPWLRWVRMNVHTGGEFIVHCQKGHGALYKDFATHVVEADMLVVRADCANAWLQGTGRLMKESYFSMMKRIYPKITRSKVLCAHDMQYTWGAGEAPKLLHAKHTIYGDDLKPTRDAVVIHARECKDKQPERNWSLRKWRELITENPDKHFVAIGKTGSAQCPGGAEDSRDLPLADVMNIMANASIVIGPSSGPLHLANACGTSVQWWSGNKKDISRYATDWNPNKLANVRVDGTWNPPLAKVNQCLNQST